MKTTKKVKSGKSVKSVNPITAPVSKKSKTTKVIESEPEVKKSKKGNVTKITTKTVVKKTKKITPEMRQVKTLKRFIGRIADLSPEKKADAKERLEILEMSAIEKALISFLYQQNQRSNHPASAAIK